MKILTVILLILSAVLILMLGACYLCFLRACGRSRRRDPSDKGTIKYEKYRQYKEHAKECVSAYNAENKEEISVKSFDGLTLRGSYIKTEKALKGTVIAFHGYRSSACADFSPIYRELLQSGYSLILPDQRAHGRSDGKYIGFGALERKDTASWCRYAKERFGNECPIFLYGISMGASTVLFAAAQELEGNVRGVIADCGFTSPIDIIKNTLKHKNKLPPFPTANIMSLYSSLLAGYSFFEVNAKDTLKKSSLPVLIIHGANDTYVPTKMSKEIFSARPDNTTLAIFENATHARSHFSNKDKYLKTMTDFMENSL